ncbi:hypothetical protein HK096_008590, partial [Nowakowskiella sp. JEL0078]
FATTFRRSPTKDRPSLSILENDPKEFKIQLGNVAVSYANNTWNAVDEIQQQKASQEIKILDGKNRQLTAENQILKFKVNVLL